MPRIPLLGRSRVMPPGGWAALCLLVCLAQPAWAQAGRDYVFVVGSSTVYPFSTIVAERFGRISRYRTPKVESTGSGGGIKLFCDGLGTSHPDIVNSSRRISASEMARCLRNGVADIVEVRFGYDGIILANAASSPSFSLTSEQIFLALAKNLPTGSPGELKANPYERWSDVDAVLPDLPIEVLGPPPTSGTRDAFVALVMEAGCRATPWIERLAADNPDQFRQICHGLREDGGYVEAGENDNVIVQKLSANPSAVGIVGFSFVDQNPDIVKGSAIDGVLPTFDSIASLDYPVSRPLFFYIKKSHVAFVPGLREFVAEFTSERSWGELGYLAYRGLVPLPAEERRAIASSVDRLDSLNAAAYQAGR